MKNAIQCALVLLGLPAYIFGLAALFEAVGPRWVIPAFAAVVVLAAALAALATKISNRRSAD